MFDYSDNQIIIEELGTDVTFTLADETVLGGIKGIFDSDYANPVAGELNLDSSNYTLTCITSEISSIKKGDFVEVDDISYEIVHIQPDGTGMTTLVLSDV